MTQKTADDYLKMQRTFYDEHEMTAEELVGHYEYHENFPYETQLLYFNGDVRKPIFSDYSDKKAFDIACGEGRMIRRMEKVFGAGCDGSDISTKMVAAARERSPNATVFQANGDDCGDAPESAYDFAFSTISLQHIASYTVRSRILKDVTRILKPGGKMTIQMLMSEHYPFLFQDHMQGDSELLRKYLRKYRHAGYFEDKFDAEATNSGVDALIGTADIPKVLDDIRTYFEESALWVYDISIGRNFGGVLPRRLDPTHPNSHLHEGYHGTHFVFLHGVNPRK